MKQYTTVLFFFFLLCGSLLGPAFSFAKETCYVDGESDNGDGSKEDPYEDISEALDRGCTKIIVNSGTHKDALTIEKSVKIEGKSKDKVIITGKIKMKDNSKIENITVDGGGIEIDDGADAEIENVRIKNASIGIKTTGRGKLIVKDTAIYDNGKGMYVQAGKNVSIKDCDIRDNDEEGIDIRANVDGEISNNSIEDNGESGIEVILGKAELLIVNNDIKDNRASGIALQYYENTSKIGAVKVKGNVISSNKDFGVNCKAPSGGKSGADYWSASTNMSSNKVQGNKDGNFSQTCYFSDETVLDATMTQEQKQEQERLAAEVAAQKVREQELLKEEELLKEQEQKANEDLKKEEEQIKLREQLQKNAKLQGEINIAYAEITELANENIVLEKKASRRFALVKFLIGSHYGAIAQLEESLLIYDEKIITSKGIRDEITDEKLREAADQKIIQMKHEQQQLQSFISNQKNEFSLFGWIFNNNKK